MYGFIKFLLLSVGLEVSLIFKKKTTRGGGGVVYGEEQENKVSSAVSLVI